MNMIWTSGLPASLLLKMNHRGFSPPWSCWICQLLRHQHGIQLPVETGASVFLNVNKETRRNSHAHCKLHCGAAKCIHAHYMHPYFFSHMYIHMQTHTHIRTHTYITLNSILYYIILYYIILYYIYYKRLYYIIFHIIYYIILKYMILYDMILYYIILNILLNSKLDFIKLYII